MAKKKCFQELDIKKFSDIKKILYPKNKKKRKFLFRGQPDYQNELKTSLDRFLDHVEENDKYKVEPYFIEEFQRGYSKYSHKELPLDNRVGWWALMQHYGTPTRLLDWTYSLYVATFFALEDLDKVKKKKAAAVWAIDSDWLETKYEEENEELKKALSGDPHMKKIETFALFNGKPMILRITPFDLNERLSVQQGCFLMPGKVEISFMDNLEKFSQKTELTKNLYKFNISYKGKEHKDILGDLFRMNISRTSLFPGLDGYAKSFGTAVYSMSELLNKRAFLRRIQEDNWAFQENKENKGNKK